MAETIAQRDLRNRSAEILRRAHAGEAFIVTNNGLPVAKVGPLDVDTGPRISRRGKRRRSLPMPTRRVQETTAAIMADLRGDR